MQLKDISVKLPHKPTATLRISALFPGTSSPEFADPLDITSLPPSSTLLVFLNGLILPRSSWNECISRFLRIRDKQRRCASSSNSSASFDNASGSKDESGTGNANKHGSIPKSNNTSNDGTHVHVPSEIKIPNILTYDRFGQGESDRDPSDPDPEIDNTPYGHSPLDVIADLHQLLLLISQYLSQDLSSLNLVFIANSIGCPLARLFNHHHSQVRVTGYLFLDSMMANSDFISVFPDPDSPEFDPEKDLRQGVSEEDLRWTRQKFREKFHPSVGNTERLDRRGLRTLLPWADRPKLTIPPLRDGEEEEEDKNLNGKEKQEQEQEQEQAGMREGTITRPKAIVIGHDWDVFADQNEKGPMSIPKAVINGYMNPAWQRYNEGLTRLAAVDGNDDKDVVPVKIAKDCGHFIQKDDPELVARELDYVLRGLGL
ncbi:hypothetical protein B0T09DRAFT_409976 [Sordaria sp. MPI-SDFR-AT-0083]|nr:hypothetical protein B0T09DRAFT_409976 [Sordaria sp. MPI-SDFR-AT-0083]